MTKTVRNISIASAVIIILIIGIIVVSSIETEENLPANNENNEFYTVYSEEADNISAIEIIGGTDNIKATNLGNSVWTINDFDAEEIDTSKAYGIAGTVSQLSSKNKVEENASDLSVYGLDNPSVTVKITKKNGKNDTLYIGDKSPALGEYFIIKDGESTVYTMYEFKVDTLLKPISYYREFNRFNINIDDICGIKIMRQDEVIDLKIIDEIDENTSNVWRMLSPYQSNANDDYIDNKILEPISEIAMNTPVEDTDGGITDKSPVLLLTVKPYDNITGKYGDEYTETLNIGKSVNGKTYVKYKENIYIVEADSINFINDSSFNIVSKMQALVDISKVKSVNLEYNGEKHSINITKSGSSYSFKADGSDADAKLSQTMYQAIISLAVDGVYNGETAGETIFKITYVGNNQADDTVIELKSIDDLSCMLVRNGKADFLIKKSKIDELTATFNSYIKNYN